MREYCVILAGGGGKHFWPLTRDDKPKQFQPILPGGPSFLQETYNRAKRIFPEDRIYIVSLQRFRGLLFEQLPDIPEDHLLLEPFARNTATSIGLATCTLLARDPEAVMVVSAADHLIYNVDRFADSIRKAVAYSSGTDTLLTIGVVPTSPNTNFGYVQIEGGREAYVTGVPVKAKTFTEKPSAELAKVFVDSGEFLWNSGIFVWKASAISAEMKRCCPEITRLWAGWEKAFGTIRENRFIERVYADSPNISIDYAVLEKSDKLWVLPSDFDWQDVGNFTSYYDYTPLKDADGNLTVGVEGKLFAKDSKRDILYCNNPRKLMVVRGLEDYLVIDTDDVLLISPRKEEILQDTIRELKSPEYEEFS